MTALDTPLGAEPAGEATMNAVPPFEQSLDRPAADARPSVRLGSVLANSEYEIVSRWAEDKRAELARLTQELRAAEAEAEAAERALRQRQVAAGRTPPAPSDLIPMVDALLADAMRRLDDEVAAARQDAETIVSGALQKADDVLRQAGVDLTASIALRPAVEPVLPVVELVRPRPAVELLAAVVDPPVVVDLTESPSEAEVTFLGGAERDDAADLNQIFWADAEAEEAVRNRLRRWVQRQS